MRYERATNVEAIPKGIRLTGPGKLQYELQRFDQHMYFLSSRLTVRNSTYIQTDLRQQTTAAKSITAELAPRRAISFAFENDQFLGKIDRYGFQCYPAAETKTFAQVWKPNDYDPHLRMNILIHLEERLFGEIFHPIWLRQAKSVLDLNVKLIGYQWAAEAGLSSPGDTHNLVFEAENDVLQPSLISIALSTEIQGTWADYD